MCLSSFSFFVSRIDTKIDKLLSDKAKADTTKAEALKALMGKAAIANAKLVYEHYQKVHRSERWKKLANKGVFSQRLLWGSTGTKNPSYSDVLYVNELIGPETVNTVPVATLNAFRDHGELSNSLTSNLGEAHNTLELLATYGISLDQVTDQLLDEGIKLFGDSFDQLLANLKKKTAAVELT